MSSFDPDYVQEILRALPAGLSRAQLQARCQPDRNAGYGAEVEAAERAYFATGASSAQRAHRPQ